MRYAVLDIEATGGKKGEEKIIDIAIYQFNGEEVTDQFGSMINPQRGIDRYVQKLTGITNKMVKGAPKFHEMAKRIVEITQDCVIVGHGVDFDYRMLRQEFSELGFPYERETLDTLSLSKELIPEAESHSLGKLCKSLGIPMNNRHRAQGDTLATLELFKLLLKKDKKKNIIESHAHPEPTSQEQVRKLMQLEQDLPQKTGVYYYHNKRGKVFYIRAARNIASEINNDFTSDKKVKQRIQSQVESITKEITGSFLVALLKQIEERQNSQKILPLFPADLYFNTGLYIEEKETALPEIFLLKRHLTQKRPLLLFPSKAKAREKKESLEKEFGISEEDTVKERKRKINRVKKSLQYPSQNMLLVDRGRSPEEKCFILIKENKLRGYGFFKYHNQVENKEIRDALMLPLKNTKLSKSLIITFLKRNKAIKRIDFDKDTDIKIKP